MKIWIMQIREAENSSMKGTPNKRGFARQSLRGLLACGHPVGATGLMQAVTMFLAVAAHDRKAFRQ